MPETTPDPSRETPPPSALRATGGARAFEAFRVPSFGSLWSSNLLHFFGLQIQLFTLQWLVTDLTESRTLIGLIIAIQGVTVALLSPAAGVTSDRFARRDLLALCRAGLGLTILAMLMLVRLGDVELMHLYGFAVVMGCLTALSQPPSQTFLFDVVGRERTQGAVALNSAAIGLGQMAGPGLAGVLVGAVGITGSWLAAAIGLLVAAVLVIRIPIRGLPSGERHSPLRELVEGFAYVWRHPPLRLVMFVCAMSFFNGSLAAMRPVFARHVLDVGSQGMGMMAASMGAGTLIGALAATALPDYRRPGMVISLAMFGFGLMIVLYSMAFSFRYILVIEFCAGLFAQLWQISTFAGLQMSVSEEMRGRVMGIVFTVAQLALVGGVFVGRLADGIGDQRALAVFGAIATVTMAIVLLFGRGTLARLGESNRSPA